MQAGTTLWLIGADMGWIWSDQLREMKVHTIGPGRANIGDMVHCFCLKTFGLGGYLQDSIYEFLSFE